MGSRASANTNPFLTGYAQGIAPDLRGRLANFIAPIVSVPATIGHFKRYDATNMFQTIDTARALGGARARIEFNADDPTYNCKPQAGEITIDDAERDANGDNQLALEQMKTRTLLTAIQLSYEVKLWTAIKAGLAATGGIGVWSNAANNNPITEIDALILDIAVKTGQMPNRIAMGIQAWAYVRSHSKVLARFPGASKVGVTYGDFASLLLNPAIELQVGVLSSNAKKVGATQDNENIVGAEVFIFYASQNPDTFDASFAKVFQGGRGGVDSIKMYRAENCASDVLAADWSEDMQITTAVCGRRITVT